jgi:tRNA modification GTPase
MDGDISGPRDAPRSGATLGVSNKADLPRFVARRGTVAVSASTGEGLDVLRHTIVDALGARELADRPGISNIRHIALLTRAHASMQHALEAVAGAGGALSEEFVLADLADARAALEEISGKRTPDDVLHHIFQRFCVGK